MDYRAAEAWSEAERRVDELRLVQEWVTNHAEGAQWHAGWETVEAEVSDLRRRLLGERDAAKRSSAAERHREETAVLQRIDGLLPRLRALEDAAHVAVWDTRARDIYSREARDVLQAHGAWHTVLNAAEATDDTVGLDILATLDAEAHRVIRWVGPTNPATPAEVPRQALADLSAARTALDRELRRGVDRVLMPRVKWTKDTRVSDAGRRDRRLRKAARAAHRHGFASEVFGVEAPGDPYTAAGVSAWWDEADAARDAQDFAAYRRRRTRVATERRVRTERGPTAALRLTPQHRAAAGDTRAGYAAHRKKRVGRFLLSLAWRLPVVFRSGVLASLAVGLAASAMASTPAARSSSSFRSCWEWLRRGCPYLPLRGPTLSARMPDPCSAARPAP